MRSFLEGPRRRRRSERFRSRFQRGAATQSKNRSLIRFRRNRELMAREMVTLALWIVIAGMLALLARALGRVVDQHLAERELIVRVGLPALPLIAALGCLWRARAALREYADIRREQRQLLDDLRAE